MEMKNSAYSQEKRASAPPQLYDQEAARESNQGASSRDQSPQLYATTSLYQTEVIQDAQEVGGVKRNNLVLSSMRNENF